MKAKLDTQQYINGSNEGWEASSMAYQMTVTLSDQEYQVLAAEATKRGEQPERERLAHLFASDRPASDMVIEDRGPY